ASVGNASGGGAAGSNQSTATASSPAVGRAAGSASLAANQTPMVGFSGSWKFDATWTTSPITTSTPASSRASRAAAARTSSPHSTKPHGKHHRPAPNCPGARRTRSTRPAASRMTHAAPTPGLAKKTKPQRGQLGRGMPPRTTRTSAVRHRGQATQSSPGKGIGPDRMADRDGPVQGRRPFTAGRRRARDAPSARRSTMRPYAYDRLSFLDNSFLITESPTNHMHVAGTATYEAGPLRRPDGGIDIDRIRDYVASRLHLIPRYRQVLAWTPIEGHPVWVDDAHFNIDYHVRHTARATSSGPRRYAAQECPSTWCAAFAASSPRRRTRAPTCAPCCARCATRCARPCARSPTRRSTSRSARTAASTGSPWTWR